MSVGGKVTEIKYSKNFVSVNTNDGCEYCAVNMTPNSDSFNIEIGDTVWWQSGNCFWTKKDGSNCEVKIKKVGYSYSW